VVGHGLRVLARLGDAGVRRNEVWTRLVESCPLHAHLLDGEPITDVLAISGTIDRYRRFVVDGLPVATGVLAVADAWACTNPSLVRGISLGLRHAVRMRDVCDPSSAPPVDSSRPSTQ
jgi:hypothetical protein